MNSVLVRRREFEGPTPPAGDSRARRFARGAIPSFAFRALGVHCVDTSRRVFALTYDDGPDPDSTPRVLDALRRHGAVATFFVLTEAARRHPDVLRRIVDEGHEIALHGSDHRSLLQMSTTQAR